MGHEIRSMGLRVALFLCLVLGLAGCGKAEKNFKPELTIDLGNGLNMEFVVIHSGSFLMGTTNSDIVSYSSRPQHRVKISQSFYLGKYLVTQEQWQSLMGDNPSTYKEAKCPVESVTWSSCQVFLGKLKEKVPGTEFCLPTEAQWEYACRAGSTGDYCYGDEVANLGEYAWYDENSGGVIHGRPHPVGQKKPNAWGLYDMHGNVFEWCIDFQGDNYYAHSPSRDPQGPTSGSGRMCRGGNCRLSSRECRSDYRLCGSPEDPRGPCGLRVCIVNLH